MTKNENGSKMEQEEECVQCLSKIENPNVEVKTIKMIVMCIKVFNDETIVNVKNVWNYH